MSNLIEFALHEFELLKNNRTYPEDCSDEEKLLCDKYDAMIEKDVIALLKLLEEQSHSGSSITAALYLLDTLAKFKPLSPLTGEDSEWINCYDLIEDDSAEPIYQNKRCYSVFKDGKNGKAYNIDGIVFYDVLPDGTHSYYTCKDSKVYIDFPYTVPDKPEYRERPSDAGTD